ncbi:MAG: MoaD/ThiS family protein [Sphaerobacter sp.]|nr:MoaD/ThiS family protein [Sphaerobacter sp.]
MDVQVRLGPDLSQLTGAPRLTVTLAPGATVRDLLAHLGEAYPALAGRLGAALPVVGGVCVADGHVLAPGADVALLSPVSGGSAGCRAGIGFTAEGMPWR